MTATDAAVARDATPEILVADLGFTEGPAQLGEDRVVFTSASAGTLHVLAGRTLVHRVDLGAGPTGIAVAADGSLWVAQNSGQWGAPSVQPAGILRVVGHSVEYVLSEEVSAPNDICFGPDGRVWFTDPVSERALHEPVPGRVYAYDPASRELEVVVDGVLFPNGLAFDPSGTTLYVNETFTTRILAVDITRGLPTSPRVLCEIPWGGGDGMAVTENGELLVCVPPSDSIVRISAGGEVVERLHCGDGSFPSNCCFGGPDRRSLFVTLAHYGALGLVDPGVAGLPLHTG
jgi:gluconolactonase